MIRRQNYDFDICTIIFLCNHGHEELLKTILKPKFIQTLHFWQFSDVVMLEKLATALLITV